MVFIIITWLHDSFFTLALADGFPRDFVWQQVSLSLQDSCQYSGQS